MRKFEEYFVALWCLVMPMTGTLLLPGVQGTIPPFMMAFFSIVVVLSKIRTWNIPSIAQRYLLTASLVLVLWFFLFAGSQLGLLLSDRRDFGDISLIDPSIFTVVMRSTIFTQSLYLMCCVLIALYFRYFFQEKWMRYVFWGGYFLALYGIYEWLYFLIFHDPGDFLVNRTFYGGHSASWSQTISFAGITLLRIKSTMLEPSVFSAAVIPYFFLALDSRKMVLAALLLFTAIFSTSTSCYLALSACLVVRSFWTGEHRWLYVLILLLLAIFLTSMAIFYPDSFRDLFQDKLNATNQSGSDRLNAFYSGLDLLGTYNLMNWIFGVGVGCAYVLVPFAALINTGVIGLAVFLWAFLKPLILLPATPGYGGIRLGIFALVVLFMISLSEFYVPTTWMFLGLAYYKLDEYRRIQREKKPNFHHPKIVSEPENTSGKKIFT